MTTWRLLVRRKTLGSSVVALAGAWGCAIVSGRPSGSIGFRAGLVVFLLALLCISSLAVARIRIVGEVASVDLYGLRVLLPSHETVQLEVGGSSTLSVLGPASPSRRKALIVDSLSDGRLQKLVRRISESAVPS